MYNEENLNGHILVFMDAQVDDDTDQAPASLPSIWVCGLHGTAWATTGTSPGPGRVAPPPLAQVFMRGEAPP